VPGKNPTRIPQETGSDLLIQATLKLARERPISKVGLRDIAVEANLQTMHIKRYFGSRNELLIACTDRLMEIITLENIDKPLDQIFANFSNSKDIELRLRHLFAIRRTYLFGEQRRRTHGTRLRLHSSTCCSRKHVDG
jgi:AcrR family transcriptional regulator